MLVSPLQSQVFAVPAGDAGGPPVVILGPFGAGQPVVFTVEYDAGTGPLQKVFSPFPQLTPVPFIETITVGAGPDITDWHEEAGRIITGTQITDRLVWIDAIITLDDGSSCGIAEPDLISICGDITIERGTSGTFDPPGNPIFDLIWFDFPNKPQVPGDTFIIQKTGFYPFAVSGGVIGLGVNEFPTSQPPGCTSDVECQDGLFCNGAEFCDPNGVCQAGTPIACDDSLFCNGLETCNEATDACDPGTSPACDDSLFCNGLETCNEATDVCDPGTTVDPNDGVGCTSDSCNEATDSVDNIPNDAVCDNGLFCDGAEICDAAADCQAGVAPAADDGVACTDDTCNEDTDTVTNTANDANCDNGQLCDGTETCDAVLDCQAGIAPNIDDGVACTDDSCTDANGVQNTPNDANCDNGVVCDGAEICNATSDCQAGPPAQQGASCEDGDECTLLDACDGAGACASGIIDPNDLTCSPNGPPSTQIGGEIISINSSALLVAGAQSNLAWILTALVAAVGIGIFVVSRKSEQN